MGGQSRPREVVTGVQLADGHTRGCSPVGDLLPLVGRVPHRRREDLADGPSVEHPGETVDVVRVKVGQHDRVDDLDPQPVEAVVDEGRIRPDVHDDGAARAGRENQPVTLAHVTGDEPPPRQRPGQDMGRYGSADGKHHHANRKEGTSPGLMAQPGASSLRAPGWAIRPGDVPSFRLAWWCLPSALPYRPMS